MTIVDRPSINPRQCSVNPEIQRQTDNELCEMLKLGVVEPALQEIEPCHGQG